MTPALQFKNRCTAWIRLMDARQLGEQTAIAGRPWQANRHADPEEHAAYMEAWSETNLKLGQLAEAEAECEAVDCGQERPGFLARMWRKFVHWGGE